MKCAGLLPVYAEVPMKRGLPLYLLFLVTVSASCWAQTLQWRKNFGPGDFDINAKGTKLLVTRVRASSSAVAFVYDAASTDTIQRVDIPYWRISRAIFDPEDSIYVFFYDGGSSALVQSAGLSKVALDSTGTILNVVWKGSLPLLAEKGELVRAVSNAAKTYCFGGIIGNGQLSSDLSCVRAASSVALIRLHLKDTSYQQGGLYEAENTMFDDAGGMAEVRSYLVWESTPYCRERTSKCYVIYDSTGSVLHSRSISIYGDDRIGPFYTPGGFHSLNDSLFCYASQRNERAFPVIPNAKFLSNNHLLYPTDKGMFVRHVLDDSVVFAAVTPDSASPVSYQLNADRTALFVRYADTTIAKWTVDFSMFTDVPPALNDLYASRYSVNENESIDFSLRAYPQTRDTRYTWLFGDGTTTTGRDVKHVYVKDGIYTVTCIAEFSGGVVDTMVKKDFITVRTISPFVKRLIKLPLAENGERVTAMRYRQDGRRMLIATNMQRLYEYDAQSCSLIREVTTEGTLYHIAYFDSSAAFSMSAGQGNLEVTKYDLNTPTQVSLAHKKKYYDPLDNAYEWTICYLCEIKGFSRGASYLSFMSSDDMGISCGGRVEFSKCTEDNHFPGSTVERFCSITSSGQWRKGLDTLTSLFSSFFFNRPTNSVCDKEAYSTFNVSISKDGRQYTAVESLYEARTTRLEYPRALRVRSTADGSLIKAYLGDDCTVACFNADGTRVVSSNRVWNVATGDSIDVSIKDGPVLLERFNANADVVLAATADTAAQLHFIDLATGTSRMNLGRSISRVDVMTISPDCKTITTAMRDGSLLFWQTPDSLITIQTSVADESEDFDVRGVYPNPASSEVRVQLVSASGEDLQPELYDPLGQRLAVFPTEHCTSGINTITLQLPQSLGSGSYVVCLRSKRSMKAMPVMIAR